jgi:hypothetical protein
MSDEARGGIKISLKSVVSSVMAATGNSMRTLARVIKEGKEIDKGTSASLFNIGDITSKKEGRSRRWSR